MPFQMHTALMTLTFILEISIFFAACGINVSQKWFVSVCANAVPIWFCIMLMLQVRFNSWRDIRFVIDYIHGKTWFFDNVKGLLLYAVFELSVCNFVHKSTLLHVFTWTVQYLKYRWGCIHLWVYLSKSSSHFTDIMWSPRYICCTGSNSRTY